MQRIWSLTLLMIWCLSGPGLSSASKYAHLFNNASDACIAASRHPWTCPRTLKNLLSDKDHILNSTQLKDLCEGPCLSSLVRSRDLIKEQCGPEVTRNYTDGSLYKPAYLEEWAVYVVDRACYKKGNGQYCNQWFQNPSPEEPLCDECWQFILWHNAQTPLLLDRAAQESSYASVSSSCGYAEQPTHTYEQMRISPPTTTPNCTSKYTIQDGDTLLSVSKSQRVATHDLVVANRLGNQIDNFPSSGELCIRHQCDVYVVKEGDTCESIQIATDLTSRTLGAWNPFINHYCDNISSYVNQTICVSNPNGDCKCDCNAPKNQTLYFSGPPAVIPTNIAPDTKRKCGIFHNVTAGDDCSTIGSKYGISLDDLVFFNPTIGQNCTNLSIGTSYCVAPVGDIINHPGYIRDKYEWMLHRDIRYHAYIPLANGTREDCLEYHDWSEGLLSYSLVGDCHHIASTYKVTFEQFVRWNPSLDQNAKDEPSPTYDFPCRVSPNVQYCVQLESPTPKPKRIPSPRAAGEIENCTKWFLAYFPCNTQLRNVRMSMKKMYRYNPSLNEDCSGYTLGTFYCHQTFDDLLYGYSEDEPKPTASGSSSEEHLANISPDGTCGGDKGYVCEGSQFGSCCSQHGYCKTSFEHCGDGCQYEYGACLDY